MLCDYYHIFITLTLQINVTYLDISISNIPIIPRHGFYLMYACSQSEPVLQYNAGSGWLGAYTE